ncbi:MAG: hypothetical protein RR711_12295 [Bacteroides sp.]
MIICLRRLRLANPLASRLAFAGTLWVPTVLADITLSYSHTFMEF